MTPPFLARLLVRARFGAARTEVEADILELFEERWRTRGRLYAYVRYWQDALSLWLHAMPAREHAAQPRQLRIRWLSDLRWGWRSLCARPGASLGIIAVLSLGIALAATMFALADPYILRPLPFERPEELVTIAPPRQLPLPGAPQREDTATIGDWRARTTLFSGVAAFDDDRGDTIQVRDGDRFTSLRTLPVSANFFSLLGLRPPASPDWQASPDQSAAPLVVADAALGPIGRLLEAPDGRRWRVAGVLPRSFVFPDPKARGRITGLVPLDSERMTRTGMSGSLRWSSTLRLIGRLQSGVTPEIANAALVAEAPRAAGTRLPGLLVEGLAAAMTRQARPVALGATAAGVLIFLACAANIGNLLVTRGTTRWREFAARQAMGATGGDLARLVLVELAGLTAVSMICGLALAAAALKVMAAVIPESYTALGMPAITVRVALFSAAIGFVVMVIGAIPASLAWRVKPGALFNAAQPGERPLVALLRFAMTAMQAAIAMVLLIGGALLVRSYDRLTTQDIGFSPEAFVMSVVYPGGARPSGVFDTAQETVERLRRVAGIRSPAAVMGSLGDSIIARRFAIVDGQSLFVTGKSVTPAYPDATGSRLAAGRFFTAEDGNSARVVNQAFATLCCGGRSPIGSVVALGEGQAATIVGVLQNAFDSALDTAPEPLMLQPMRREPIVGSGVDVRYVFRTTGDVMEIARFAERAILGVDAAAVVSDASTLGDRLSNTVRDRSFATLVVTLFGATALAVSVTGLFAVIGFAVARRTREIAIRVAVGAPAAHVRWIVAREALAAGAFGTCCGLAIGGWLSRTLTHLLYGIEPLDPWSFVAAAAVLTGAAAVAASIPARRALRIVPTEALKCE